jgi:hypothetical protein
MLPMGSRARKQVMMGLDRVKKGPHAENGSNPECGPIIPKPGTIAHTKLDAWFS